MRPNFSVVGFIQTEYDQEALEPCIRAKSCFSLGKVTGVVPANEPPITKSDVLVRDNEKD